MDFRIGFGEDAHLLVASRPLILGAVRLLSERGPRAHSDGDALLHALSDALLSAVAEGDIGDWFPVGAERTKDLSSQQILRFCLDRVAAQGWSLVNLSAVVTLDQPKLAARRAEIAASLAALTGLARGRVGLGFKTSEGLAPDHLQARATVLIAARAPARTG